MQLRCLERINLLDERVATAQAKTAAALERVAAVLKESKAQSKVDRLALLAADRNLAQERDELLTALGQEESRAFAAEKTAEESRQQLADAFLGATACSGRSRQCRRSLHRYGRACWRRAPAVSNGARR